MFLFKKIVAPLFFPLPVCLIIFAVGLILICFTRRPKTGKALITIGFALLLVLSYNWVSGPILRRLEHYYEPLVDIPAPSEVKWIVVLGGGTSSDPSIPPTARLSPASLARIVEGVRLQKQLPEAKLIVSGGSVFASGSDAESMSNLAITMGVAPTAIEKDSTSMDTESQAIKVREMIKDDRFILVTSASHMRRAVALFKKAGLDPIPAPTHYLIHVNEGSSPTVAYPSSGGIGAAETVTYEYLGLLWAKLRGKI